MRSRIAMGLAVVLLMGATPANDDVPRCDDTVQGVWKLIGGEADGQGLSKEQLQGGKLIIKGARYAVTLAGLGTVTGTQTLGVTEDFQTIDIVDDSGSHEGQVCLGIYEMEGDEFRVVFAAPGGARPSEFKTAPGSGQWMHTWQRVLE